MDHAWITVLPVFLLVFPVSQCESFRDSPVSITALTHTPLNLTCYAPDPSPPPLIIWLVNDIIFQENDIRRNVVYDPTTGRSIYQLLEVEYSDAGQYQCRAVSEVGSELFQSDVGTLTVQGQPAFKQSLLPVVTPIGSQAIFQCCVISNPPATVSWTFGHPLQNLSNGGRIFLNSSVLIISNVQSSDEGYYHCIAQNSFGVNSTSAALSIGDPPPLELTIYPAENPLQIVEGSDVTLHCTLNAGAPADTLHWSHNGQEITAHVTRESHGLALSLEGITVEEGGEYSCVASRADGFVISQSVQLEILIPPTVELVPNVREVVAVDYRLDLTPECTASGNPQPTITWLAPNGEPLVVEGDVPLFGHLSRSSSGVYVCVATNSVGEDRVELTLVVEDAPLITVPPSDTLAAYGSDVTLTCTAEGPPTPTIVWSREDGGQLGNSSVELTGTLHLFSVAMEDSGVYVCEASNGYDPVARETATLTVLSPPRVASLAVVPSSTVLSGSDFSIQCTVANPTVPFSIQWYRDGTLLAPTGDPRIQIETETDSGMLTVYSTDESYSAVYMCNVSTSYAFDTAQVTITVGSVPVIVTVPSDIDLKPGQGTSIDCAVTGTPNPRIEWFVTNEMGVRSQLITTAGEYYIIHTDRLELREVTQLNSGVYECVVQNELGSDVGSARVRVEGLPLPLSFSPTVLIADDNHTLTCDIIYNFPVGTITWRTADSTPLSGGRFSTTPTGVLEITPVDPSDEGMYECVATNEYGEAVVSGQVTVHVRPTVVLPSSSVTAILFSNVTLVCSVDGDPAPSQQWSLNGLPLSGSRYVLVGGTDITIITVLASDMGSYTCTASNEVGVATAVLEVLVRGAPVTDLTAAVLNSTSVTLTWSHPPSHLTLTLSTYHILYGSSGSRGRETLQLDRTVTSVLVSGLEEATQYEFSVFGDYGDVPGVEVTVTVTTDEDTPRTAPRNVTLDGEIEALDISWLVLEINMHPVELASGPQTTTFPFGKRNEKSLRPPVETDRNGVIVRYDIYYRKMEEEGSEGDNTTFESFSKAEHTPPDPLSERHSTRLGGLEGGRRYEVKIGAATSVGVGPNSTVVTAETLELFPLLLVLAIAIPAATILLLLSLLVSLCVCYRCCYRGSRAGKHSPLVEDTAYSQQLQRRQRKRRGRRVERVISGPVPGVPPNIEATGGKFAMRTQQGELLSSEPKVIMPEDVATPPQEGGMVRQVPHDEVLTSLKTRPEDDPYEEIGHFTPSAVQHQPTDPPPNLKSNPLYRTDSQDGPKVWVNPQYDRMAQSDEPVVPFGNQTNPNDYGPQPDMSIMLQVGSLPHMAHNEEITPETEAGLRDKSQSLDMNAKMWTGLPLIREAETECSDGSVQGGEAGGREERGGEGETGWGEDEMGEWVQQQGDGWEVPLVPEESHTWGEEGTTREAEQEEEEEGEERKGVVDGGKRRHVTSEGWEERYVGEDGEDPEIMPAQLGQIEDELRASDNSLDLASQRVEPVSLETEDDTQHLYATVSASHKAKKRIKMMKEAQKREMKARKEKHKMEERLEKERRKARERERKAREKERKTGGTKLRDEMGLGNVVRLQDIDSSTHTGRAQAQFIDAATAAIF